MNDTSRTGGIPGLRGTDHIGFTVPDIEEAVAFFRDVIGCDVFYPMGPVEAGENGMARRLNVAPTARIKQIRVLRCRNGANFEIMEYEAPDQVAQSPRNSDIGGHHIAFYVDDMEAAVAYLTRCGVTILGTPERKDYGPSAGETWVYFLTPWGMHLELVSYPDGKAYEAQYRKRLWHPGFM